MLWGFGSIQNTFTNHTYQAQHEAVIRQRIKTMKTPPTAKAHTGIAPASKEVTFYFSHICFLLPSDFNEGLKTCWNCGVYFLHCIHSTGNNQSLPFKFQLCKFSDERWEYILQHYALYNLLVYCGDDAHYPHTCTTIMKKKVGKLCSI